MAETTRAAAQDSSNLKPLYQETQRFIDELANKQKTISEATGALRSRLKEILEQTEHHKGAFAMIRKIDGMSQTARADFLRTFEELFDAMMSYKWRDEMRDMLDGTGEEEE